MPPFHGGHTGSNPVRGTERDRVPSQALGPLVLGLPACETPQSRVPLRGSRSVASARRPGLHVPSRHPGGAMVPASQVSFRAASGRESRPGGLPLRRVEPRATPGDRCLGETQRSPPDEAMGVSVVSMPRREGRDDGGVRSSAWTALHGRGSPQTAADSQGGLWRRPRAERRSARIAPSPGCPAGSRRRGRPGPARGCRSPSCAHRCARAAPAPSGCPRPAPACGSRTSAGRRAG